MDVPMNASTLAGISPGVPAGVFFARLGQVANSYPIGMLYAQESTRFVPGDLKYAEFL
jgi:hypothetical protein